MIKSFTTPTATGTVSHLKEERLIASWLSQKKPETTGRNYAYEVRKFFTMFPGLSIYDVEVTHLSAFLQSRKNLSRSSVKKSKDALSSLLSFCVKVGYINRNPAMILDRIAVAPQTSFRILSEQQVHRMINCETKMRDRLVMKMLYYAGIRVSELCGLKWMHFTQRSKGMQMTVTGKGHRVRSILIAADFWQELYSLRSDLEKPLGDDCSALFRSQKEPYNAIGSNQVRRIVARAATRVKLPSNVSPHWLRHCHATHSLERGAPIHIVQKTLGHASLTTTGKYLDAHPLDSSSNYIRFND